ncbi:hypothetical protein HELRODRAFT_167837 [Helobdella robusta]|uniref:glutathione gamma-glutamylcysteinyltransferase n=1 Tax=Helobdella robusta TaxID=6412 RepID=T1EZV0_HELRO|nr:hypothetical protein HELRODRAFT_167837 [Helobdella robusta]ESO10000.1 hypothetical protein HELRODRAFT_167837 [Helobdella robusta]
MAPILHHVTRSSSSSSLPKSTNYHDFTTKVDETNINPNKYKISIQLPEFYRRELPSCCKSFCSQEGKLIFQEALLSGHMDCYFPLAAQFRTQEEPAFCGLSTLVMVLNTLEVDPKRVWKGPWRWYHENMLDCCIPLKTIEKNGITMDQFACLAACNMLQVEMVRMNPTSSEENFRQLVKLLTKRMDKIMVVSYSRLTLEQTGDGHFSPIGGYNPERDMVLIMDTARFKYPPHWVSLPLLFRAMQMVDPTSDLPRGYFLLSKSQLSPALLFHPSSHFSPLGMDDTLTNFFKLWENLLCTELTSSDPNRQLDVADWIVDEVVRLLAEVQGHVHLLTAYLDPKLSEDRHLAYPSKVSSMINTLESLPLFSCIKSRSPPLNFDSICHAGSSSNFTNTANDSTTPDDAISIELRDVLHSLTPDHFLVMFLLSWPYHRCKRQTVGSSLHLYITTQLSRVQSKLLQNECSRLRQQLASIINFTKNSFHSCPHHHQR